MPRIRYLKTAKRSSHRPALAAAILAILIIAALTLTSCGPVRVLNSGCGGDMRKVCDAFFGPVDRQDELAEASEQQAADLEELRKQVEALELSMKLQEQSLRLEIADLEDETAMSFTNIYQHIDLELNELQTNLEAADQNLQNQLNQHRARINRAFRRIRRILSDLNTALSDIAVLQGYSNIVEIHDPCGPSTSFDEVVLELSDGSFLAYFEQGSRRFLSLLPPGNYRTTDAQSCNFTIPL